jgi:hypothetical protein
MHRLLLGGGGVFFGVRFFFGALLWQRPSKGVMRSFLLCVVRQRLVSNNWEVFSLGSFPRTRYHGKIVLLVLPELQEGEVVVVRNSVVIECTCKVNPITNPNPVYSHLTRDNIILESGLRFIAPHQGPQFIEF